MTDSPDALPAVSRRRTATLNLFFHYSGIAFTLTHAILIVPLYLKSISTALFGGWLATGNIMAWVELADPGLGTVLQQRVAEAYGAGESRRIGRIIGTGVLISACLALVPLLLWPLAPFVGPFLRLEPADAEILTRAFRLSLVALAFTLGAYGPTASNFGLQRAVAPGVAQLVSSVVGLGVTVTLLLLGQGLPSLPIGMIARAAILFFGNVWTLHAWTKRHLPERPRFDRDEFREVVGITTYTFTARLGGALIGRVDSVLLSRLVNPEAAALLGLTTRTYEPVRMVGERVGPALLPSMSHLGGEAGANTVAVLGGKLVRAVGWVAAIGAGGVMALNEPFLTLWVGSEFFAGQGVTVLAGLAVGLSILLSVYGQAVFAMGGIRQTAVMSLVEAAVKVPLQLVLTPLIGLIAMPLCALFASVVVSLRWLPRVAASLAGTRGRDELRPIAQAFLRVVVVGLVGWGLGLELSRHVETWTWGLFFVAMPGVALVLCGVLLALDPLLRRTLRDLPGRRRPPAPLPEA